MGIMNIIKGEFIDVIEWTDDSTDTLVFKYPDEDKAIKNGAQLTVRESQVAVLVNEGQIADVYQPGRHELTTANMPILTKIKSWKYGFNSPFKVDVFFVSTKQFTNEKWGTPHPVPIRDKEFGVVRIRAFGIYAFRVGDAGVFLKEVFGSCDTFKKDDITGHLKNSMVGGFADMVAESGIALLDMATQYDEISESGKKKFGELFTVFGLKMTQFFIQNISVPESVEKILDAKTEMNVIGNMGQFAQYQTAQAIRDAANNESGGVAGAGVGLGAGAAMGNMMMGNFNANANGGGAAKATVACPKCNAQVGANKKYCPECGEKMQAEMIDCYKCGAKIKENAKFCPECGAKQGKKACSECGAKVRAGAKFCPECGESL